MNEVQFLVADQPRPGEIAGADDGGEGTQPIRPVVRSHWSWWNRYALA